MKATDMLRKDHAKVAKLFERFESAKKGLTKRKIFEEIRAELDVHAKLEEAVFYPAVRAIRDVQGRSLVQESLEDHADVRKRLAEMSGTVSDDEDFEDKVDVLREEVERHVEEEQDEMFPLVEEHFGDARLQELGQQMAARKPALEAQAP
jgi:iron-sulfur cluster repair protein YtfE (RIC family)